MNKLWQQLAISMNWPVLAAVALLSTLGVSSIWAVKQEDGVKQLIFLGVAAACMALFQGVNYLTIGRYAWGLYVLSFLLILYTVAGQKISLPGVHNVKGAYAWIAFGPVSFEPAELMKLAFVLVLGRYLRFRSNYRTFAGLIRPFLLALAPMAVILKQPDLGMAMLFLPVLFAMLFVAGARVTHLLTILGAGVLLAPFIWFSGQPNVPVLRHFPQIVKSYQHERLNSFLSNDPTSAYQTYRTLVAVASGGVGGKGFGNIPIGRSVPEAHDDMILALIGEQFGFFGLLVLLGAYLVLFAAGIEISAATREPYGRLVAVGVVSVLATQSFINLFVASGMMPVTGITLPFVSYGGSSLVTSYMAAGLLLNIGQNRPLVMARESFQFG